MSYRSIVVHIDDSARCDLRLDAAARMAHAHDAELKGVYAVPTLEMTPFAAAILPGAVVDARMRDTGGAQEAARERFRLAAEKHGILRGDWTAPSGTPTEAMVREARYADLVVLGQPSSDDGDREFARDLAETVLLQSGRPVLYVPFIGTRATLGKKVLIAWKESRESVRALADALPLLARARDIDLLMIRPKGEDEDPEHVASTRVAAYLMRHGLTPVVHYEVAEDIAAGDLLVSRVSDLGSDLIVMGGYSRSRLQERVLGGVTRVILETMTVPVLMSH